MTNVIFIIVLLLVAGFVSWAGDTLGRVLGKRRISVLGLRPRRAAILITVVTGILITGLTVLSMTMMDAKFKTMLLNFDRTLQQLTDLGNQVDDRIAERDEAVVERDLALQERDRASETLIQERTIYLGQLSTIQGEINNLTTEVESMTTEVDDLTEERDQLQADKDAIIADRKAEVERLEASISDKASQVESLNGQISLLNTEIESRNSRIDELNAEIESLQTQVEDYTSGTVRVYDGQQLVVIPIDARLDGTTIYEMLRGVVNRIPETYQDPVTGDYVLSGNLIEIPIEAYSEALQSIRDLGSDMAVVVVYTTANVVEDMPVPVRFEVTRNLRVFRSGTTIYSARFTELGNATDPYRAVLARFFENARNDIVEERRLIPYASGEVLQLSIDDLLALSATLARVGLPAEIKITALQDIYRTDFLLYGEQFTVSILPVVESGSGDPD